MTSSSMFILFDSNVWISQLGLQSQNGAAVRHFARRQGATVAIPEVVRLEVEEHLTSHLIDLRHKILEGHRQLLPVMRTLQTLELPTEESIRQAVTNIIPDFDIPIRQIPFSEGAARLSLMKLLQKMPPSKKSEQFRDGVIWAHCLELLDEGDVYLVSDDKDFYEQRVYEKGLSHELIEEMKNQSETRQVKLIPKLTELLEEIRIPIDVGIDRIVKFVQTKADENLIEILSSNGFELCGGIEGRVECFATENAKKVWLKFSGTHPCQDVTGKGRRHGDLKLDGSGFLDPTTDELYELNLTRIRLDYPDWEDGGPTRGIISISAHLNAPEVHRIRVPI